MRRLVLAACGVALVGGAAIPAQAADAGDRPGGDRGAQVVAGLSLPERTYGAPVTVPTAHSAPTPPVATARPAREVVVVGSGDSLWSIAARLLPAAAPDVEVETLWRRIYAANRQLIGDDPGLIRPGQELVVPEVLR